MDSQKTKNTRIVTVYSGKTEIDVPSHFWFCLFDYFDSKR